MAQIASSRICDAQGGLVFFKFPNELRNLIYKYYLQLDGGYKLNPHANKLRTGNDKPISLDLLYTCKCAALEMRGLPFQHNIITFSAFCPQSQQYRFNAGHFSNMTQMVECDLQRVFSEFLDSSFLPDQVVKEVSNAFPSFAPLLDVVKEEQLRHLNFHPPFGQTPSTFRDFVRFTLNTIKSHRCLFDNRKYEESINRRRACLAGGQWNMKGGIPMSELFELRPQNWTIPTQNNVDDMSILSGGLETCSIECEDLYEKREPPVDLTRFCYSAAVAAIHFLDSMTPSSRADIRYIKLIEDRPSLSYPECHGLGLIRFCQENPLLRIERRVSVWDSILQGDPISMEPWEEELPLREKKTDEISYSIATWMVEALALPAAGMPQDAFKLMFVGDSEGDWECEQIFKKVVLRDAAWQEAREECFERGILPQLSWAERRVGAWGSSYSDHEFTGSNPLSRCFLFEDFPQAVRKLLNGSSLISCNFNPGEAWNLEKIIEKRRSWSLRKWNRKWSRGKQSYRRGLGPHDA
ncbi:hypothetical protein CTAM01_14166 [Colletotrichum tamarilloi]|uniref:Uncharacterized protein n=1 Tax=Colletotrichum tamarilloi TaxID=1209934 RepID=A0ABQ9QPY7_9PEZI|nr:uncharacterized protein CTAM01_14166 [Colletotrichum tamarilloi]KAK1480881.1 hypothetical protein CTAM01_14166 [Colletotrichum tamarilloi]